MYVIGLGEKSGENSRDTGKVQEFLEKKMRTLAVRTVITARKRSLRRLCFYRCLSVHGGACMGGVWQGGVHDRGACVAGGVHGRGCVVAGMCGRRSVCGEGCVWWGCAWHACPQQILQDTVNEQAVRILLECILVKGLSVADPGGPRGPCPPRPCENRS